MPEAGEILTVGEVRALAARLRATADDVEARLEGRPDDESLPPLPVPLPGLSFFPPLIVWCWPKVGDPG